MNRAQVWEAPNLDAFVQRVAKLPLHQQPGTRFRYGIHVDLLGAIIERASGQRLDRYLQGRIFGPLGMKDTAFWVPPEKLSRCAVLYRLVDGKLQPVNLSQTGHGVRVFSVVPSLDTPVCDMQTKRFNDESAKLPNVDIYNVSMDLPFAQGRWCRDMGVDHVKMLSDHRSGSFGENYGTLIKELRIESRAIFVVDAENKIRYVEYVKEVGEHPNYDAVLKAIHEIAK